MQGFSAGPDIHGVGLSLSSGIVRQSSCKGVMYLHPHTHHGVPSPTSARLIASSS